MNGTSDQPLAGAGLAEQQHGGILRRHLFDTEKNVGHGIAVTDDLAEVVLSRDLLLQVNVLRLQPLGELLDLGKSLLKRFLRPLVLLDFLHQMCVGLGQLGGARGDRLLQHRLGLLQFKAQLAVIGVVDDRGQDTAVQTFAGVHRGALQQAVEAGAVRPSEGKFAALNPLAAQDLFEMSGKSRPPLVLLDKSA